MTMEFDGGRNLVSRLGAYPDPGWYLGYDVAGAYRRNIEVGIRYIFASSNKKSKLNLLIRSVVFSTRMGYVTVLTSTTSKLPRR